MKSGDSDSTKSIFLKKDWSGRESEIKPGDIVIQLSNGLFPTDEPFFKQSISQKQQTTETNKPCRPAHIAIATSDTAYVHANPLTYGGKVYGISFFEEDRGSENSFEFVTPGEVLVLRSTNERLREQIARFAKLYEETYTFKDKEQKEHRLLNYQVNQLREDVPFRYQKTRRLDEVKREEKTNKPTEQGMIELSQLELFRAFRAYMRFTALEESFKKNIKGAPPLSKNQGVSCGNFVSYIYKAAEIATHYPNGLEQGNKIRQMYDRIEASIPRFPIKLMSETMPSEDGCYINFKGNGIQFTIIKNKTPVTIEIPLSELVDPNKKDKQDKPVPLFTWYESERTQNPNLLLGRVEKNRSILFDMLVKKAPASIDLSFLKKIGKLDAVLLQQPQLFKEFTDAVAQSFSPDEIRSLSRSEKEERVTGFVYSVMGESQAWKAGVCVKEGSTMAVKPYEDYQRESAANTKKLKS